MERLFKMSVSRRTYELFICSSRWPSVVMGIGNLCWEAKLHKDFSSET